MTSATQTFSVIIDYTMLAELAAGRVGKMTFTPRFPSNTTWTTDGSQLADAKPVLVDVSDDSPQTVTLAHPEGWMVKFGWHVKATIEGRTVLNQRMATPDPGTTTPLPDLLMMTVVLPDGTPAQMLKGEKGDTGGITPELDAILTAVQTSTDAATDAVALMRAAVVTAVPDPQNPDLLILSFPTYMADGLSVVLPIGA